MKQKNFFLYTDLAYAMEYQQFLNKLLYFLLLQYRTKEFLLLWSKCWSRQDQTPFSKILMIKLHYFMLAGMEKNK